MTSIPEVARPVGSRADWRAVRARLLPLVIAALLAVSTPRHAHDAPPENPLAESAASSAALTRIGPEPCSYLPLASSCA